MRISLFVVVLAALSSAACGVFEGGLEGDFRELASEKAATTSAEAEALYAKAEAFTARVEQLENPPKELLPKARALQQQRAREFAKAAAQNWDLGSAAKVLRALRGAKLNPEVEAKAAGIEPSAINPAVTVDHRLNADPTLDTIPAGREEVKK